MREQDVGSCSSTTCSRRRSRTRGARLAALDAASPRGGHDDVRRRLRAWMTRCRRRAGDAADRRRDGARAAGRDRHAIGRAMEPTDFVLPPLPNQLFTRDTSSWIYGGVSINPMFWPARQKETLNVEAIYRFHPRFRDAEFEFWFGGFDHAWGGATIEGGDVMPVGDGVVLVGQGERTTARAVEHPRAEPVRRGRGAARDRREDAARPRGDAPRHRLHLLRPRRRDDVRAGRRRRSCRSCYRPDGDGGVQRRAVGSLVPRRGPGRARARDAQASSPPAATSSRPSASNGTTATTSSRSARASSSPTSATRPRTPAREGRHRGPSRSPARSSAAAAAAATA